LATPVWSPDSSWRSDANSSLLPRGVVVDRGIGRRPGTAQRLRRAEGSGAVHPDAELLPAQWRLCGGQAVRLLLLAGLAQNGHVEVPGIYFGTAKAEIKPESEAALKEVVKLLQADPAVKV